MLEPRWYLNTIQTLRLMLLQSTWWWSKSWQQQEQKKLLMGNWQLILPFTAYWLNLSSPKWMSYSLPGLYIYISWVTCHPCLMHIRENKREKRHIDLRRLTALPHHFIEDNRRSLLQQTSQIPADYCFMCSRIFGMWHCWMHVCL